MIKRVLIDWNRPNFPDHAWFFSFYYRYFKNNTHIQNLINKTARPDFKIRTFRQDNERKKITEAWRSVRFETSRLLPFPGSFLLAVCTPPLPTPNSRTLFLYFSLILSLDLAPASSSSRAGARRREIRPRKGTKGGDKGKRRPRDTRTMDAEQWAAAGNSTDDEKRPLRTNYFPACAFHRILFRSSR